MLKISARGRLQGPLSVVASVLLSMFFVFAVVEAATTISTNITTGGTLTVTGVGHLQGDLNVYGGDLNLGTGSATTTLTSAATFLGIGTSTPGVLLGVAGDINANLIYGASLIATSTTATSTLFGGLKVDNGSFFVDYSSNRVSIGTSSPGVLLGVAGDINANIIYGASLVATSTTATSTFFGGLNIDANSFLVDYSSNRVSIGTSTPWGFFTVNPDQVLGPSFAIGSSTKTDFIVTNGGLVGIGTTTPSVALGVTGTTTSSTGMTIGANGTPTNQLLFGTCTYNPGAVVTTSGLTTSCTGATGVTPTHKVFVSPVQLELGLVFAGASSTAVNSISVMVFNATTTGGITPASGTWNWIGIK